MNTIILFSTITIYIVSIVYMLLNFKRDIHIFQQNSYRPERFMRWMNKHYLTPWRLVDVALLFLLLSTLLVPIIAGGIIAISLIVKMVILLRAKYKKPLVFTKRVWRLYTCSGVIALLAALPCCIESFSALNMAELDSKMRIALSIILLITIFSWLAMLIAAYIMTPVEKHINNGFRNDAMKRLSSMPDLKIVGITGSFGKTSTKHYLHRILSEKYDTLMTPGSFNTPMGVIRTIREQMKPYHEIFICEMGAKQKGDIKEICDIVHPQTGIITAVGPMHLETFHSIENVQSTKFELADSLPDDGLVVVNDDFEYCANRPVENVECKRYAVANTANADYTVTDVKYTASGTDFTVVGKDGIKLALHTKLIGECNISNLMAAVIIALRLGVEPERIQYAVSQIEQVEHRLNVKRTPGGVTIIDDAFNSNPEGSRMAVDALSNFNTGRRIIVTPGMVELGDKEFELNRALGRHIANGVDLAVIVGQYNRDALLKGIDDVLEGKRDSKHPLTKENVVVVDSFAESQQYLSGFLRSGDIVLYENDLPDTFK
ncbi:MAG: UDP-N-acetylmuramoyl-tripeptide--D-alanyl-D-alanine ligase [Prevotella sp.]|nr:UDP-N-acetylmuramoyl-tripeptide--D-alanyl-D-alanine ligase [Prevotella sp.]MCM1075612.1 UDP-N-acetylmuramoyl-tripeptide--D-alanyl-D-alanine ligase [Ruminococcus sp.]